MKSLPKQALGADSPGGFLLSCVGEPLKRNVGLLTNGQHNRFSAAEKIEAFPVLASAKSCEECPVCATTTLKKGRWN
jgi:hypothetical protein